MHGRVAAVLLGLVMVAVAAGAIHEARRPAPNHLVPFNSWVEVSNWITDARPSRIRGYPDDHDIRNRQMAFVDHYAADGRNPPESAPRRLVLLDRHLAVIEQDQLSLFVRSTNGLQKTESHSLAPRCPKGTRSTGKDYILAMAEWVVVNTSCWRDAETGSGDDATRLHRFRRKPGGTLQALPPLDVWRAGWAREMPKGHLLLSAELYPQAGRSLESLAPQVVSLMASGLNASARSLLRPQSVYRIDVPNTFAGDRSIDVLVSCNPEPTETPCRAMAVASSTYLFRTQNVEWRDAVFRATQREADNSINLVRMPLDGTPPTALHVQSEFVDNMLGVARSGQLVMLATEYEDKKLKPRIVDAGMESFGAWGTLPAEGAGKALPVLSRGAEYWSPWDAQPDGLMAAYATEGLAYARNTLDEPATIWTYDPRSGRHTEQTRIQQSADSLNVGGPFVVIAGMQGDTPAITVFKPPAAPGPEATLVLRGMNPEKHWMRTLAIQSIDRDSAVLALEITREGEGKKPRQVRFLQLNGMVLSGLGELALAGCDEATLMDCGISLVYLDGRFYLYEGDELVEAEVEGNAIRETGRWVLPQ